MDRGTYVAASGGMYQFQLLDTATNNLSNISTTGFKKQILVGSTQPFSSTFASALSDGDPYLAADHQRITPVSTIQNMTDFSIGSISTTGNPLNVAIRNQNHFFGVNTPNGVRYTRAGDFTLSADGRIVTPDGYEVIGDGGPIIATGADASISSSGQVISGGVPVGAIQTFSIADLKQLTPEGANRFKLSEGAQVAPIEADLITESLEGANVSVISGMVDLIAAHRGFEAYTKMSQSIDQLNNDAISQLSKAR